MNEHEPFLEAIRRQPDSQGPRLVYADWLDERGDPRAELIRVQCALERLDVRDPSWERLDRRERLLLGQLGGPYLGKVFIGSHGVGGGRAFQGCERIGSGWLWREFLLSGWVSGRLIVSVEGFPLLAKIGFDGQLLDEALVRERRSPPIHFVLLSPYGEEVPGWTRLTLGRFGYSIARLEAWLGGKLIYTEGF